MYQGDFEQARAHFEQALRIYAPDRDREAKFRFGMDSKVSATAHLALAAWRLGDVGRARDLIEEASALAVKSAHAPTLANAYHIEAMLEILRDDAEAVRRAAQAVVGIGREHGLAYYLSRGALDSAWANAKLGERDSGSAQLRQALAEYVSPGNKLSLPLYRGLLAEIESEGEDAEAALAEIDEALALASETGEHWFDAGLHRIRGEILLKQNPAHPAPAEAAFLAAIAVAQQQQARSFELRAALSLAKLCQSTGRPVEAHDVLGPALAGFSPTPEFPAIAEARALFQTLGQTDEVNAATLSRRQRLQLQVGLGNALLAARGSAAPETIAAFERARALTIGLDDALERFAVYYGQWGASLLRGQLGAMRELARVFLRESANQSNPGIACVAHRLNGTTHWFAGEFVEAREHHLQALAKFDPMQDRDLAVRFNQDIGATVMAHLAFVFWPLGEVDRARHIFDEMTKRSAQISHVNTVAMEKLYGAIFELTCRNFDRVPPFATALARVARDYDVGNWKEHSAFLEGWTEWYTGGGAAVTKMRRGVHSRRKRNRHVRRVAQDRARRGRIGGR